MNQLGINHIEPVGHQSYPNFVMNQLGINYTRPVGHQPYSGFVMNQLGINHIGPVGHQPYPDFVSGLLQRLIGNALKEALLIIPLLGSQLSPI